MGAGGVLSTRPPVPPPALRLALGPDLYAAVPAAQTRALAHLVRLALREIGRRDGIAAPAHLLQTLAVLEAVDEERTAGIGGARCGSDLRTAEPADEATSALWAHEITVAEAVALTGWSAGYLCRLARQGLGRKQAGAWRLDRTALLELVAARRAA